MSEEKEGGREEGEGGREEGGGVREEGGGEREGGGVVKERGGGMMEEGESMRKGMAMKWISNSTFPWSRRGEKRRRRNLEGGRREKWREGERDGEGGRERERGTANEVNQTSYSLL